MNALILLVVLIVSGAAGAVAAVILDSVAPGPENLSSSDRNAGSVWGYLIVGVVASLTVPLFLALAQSSLVQDILSPKDDTTFYRSLFVLAGFCIIVSLGARRFLNTLTNRLLS